MTSQEVQERRRSNTCFKCGGDHYARICRDKRYICNPMNSLVDHEIAVVQGKTGQSISQDIGPEKVGQVAMAENDFSVKDSCSNLPGKVTSGCLLL